MTLIVFNKPYGVVCQFTGVAGHPTLAQYVRVPEVYPAGRLDTDSEGLLLLTDDGALQQRISHPKAKLPKHYWVQVEGVPDAIALKSLATGVDLGDFVTLPAQARLIDEPAGLWPRNPPIRARAAIPTAWLELVITEGKNRQVRRMTARVGFPTLRLIRHQIGPYSLERLPPGEWREVQPTAELLAGAPAARRSGPRATAPAFRKPGSPGAKRYVTGSKSDPKGGPKPGAGSGPARKFPARKSNSVKTGR